ncbi:MAG: VTC domain-containing protein, partial [Aeromicrobium sp.]
MTALATEPHSGDTVTTIQPVLTSDVGRAHLLGVDGLRPVGLEELVEHAALMHRTDRKYIAPLDTVRTLVSDLADTHRVLEIKGRHYTTYRTLYFDTADFEAARSHVQKRRRRWKVRSRLYVEDGLCRIEVKTKDNRGETQKVMGMSDPAR